MSSWDGFPADARSSIEDVLLAHPRSASGRDCRDAAPKQPLHAALLAAALDELDALDSLAAVSGNYLISPLFTASDVVQVQRLFACYEQVDKELCGRVTRDWTAFTCALAAGYMDCARFCMQAGIDVDYGFRNAGFTYLDLLEAPSRFIQPTLSEWNLEDELAPRLLFYLVTHYNGPDEVNKYCTLAELVQNDACNIVDEETGDPLLLASARSARKSLIDVNFLVLAGADKHARSRAGETLQHIFAAQGDLASMSRWDADGVSVSVVDNQGNTPLHVAAGAGAHAMQLLKWMLGERQLPCEGRRISARALNAAGLMPFQCATDDSVRAFLQRQAETELRVSSAAGTAGGRRGRARSAAPPPLQGAALAEASKAADEAMAALVAEEDNEAKKRKSRSRKNKKKDTAVEAALEPSTAVMDEPLVDAQAAPPPPPLPPLPLVPVPPPPQTDWPPPPTPPAEGLFSFLLSAVRGRRVTSAVPPAVTATVPATPLAAALAPDAPLVTSAASDDASALRAQLEAMRLSLAAAEAAAAAAEGSRKAAAAEAAECVVCMDAVRDTALLPCRHMCVCSACADDVLGCGGGRKPSLCPLCRAEVSSSMRIFTG